MTHSQGYRCKTRQLFARPPRQHGAVKLSTYTTVYKVGQYVDVKINGAYHKGMPHRWYYGRTGTVFNVGPRAVGVQFTKRVGNRIMLKRINVRPEHIKPSNCRIGHTTRVAENARLQAEAKANNTPVCLKRQPGQPKPAHVVTNPKIVDLAPARYEGYL